MAHATEPAVSTWTAADLAERFGAIPLYRVQRHAPALGAATEADVIEIHDREGRLYELVDGVLMEKTVGTYESYLALLLGQLLGVYVRENHLGIVLGADGIIRLAPGLVRIPDVSFISWERLPGRKVPREPIADLSPDLAVEVISKGNTREEMERKLADYFAAQVRQVWYVHHTPRREVRVYIAPEEFAVLGEEDTLDGGDVLPGFTLALKGFFAEPGQAAES
ncbi:MAG: Uma2 family endonuclease [Planctomycetota bacterium]